MTGNVRAWVVSMLAEMVGTTTVMAEPNKRCTTGKAIRRGSSTGDVESTGEPVEAEAFDVDQTFAESGSQSVGSDVYDVGTPDIPVVFPLEGLDDGPPSPRTRR